MKNRTSFLILLLCLTFSSVFAQRQGTTYQSLLTRTDRPSVYFDHVSFPESDNTARFAFLFRLEYDSIPFLKKSENLQAPSPETEYYANLQVGLEIFEGQAPRSRRSSGTSNSIFRDNWQDTLWVDTYELTTSRTDYAQGILNTEIESGEYYYEVQLPRSNMPVPENRSSRNYRRDSPTPSRDFSLAGYGEAEEAEFMLLKSFQNSADDFTGTFLNYGNSVLYGQDYSVLVRIPESADTETLSLNLYRLTGGGNSDSEELRHSQEIGGNHIIHLRNVTFANSEAEVGFEAEISEEGGIYAAVEIPNHNFENSSYKLKLENRESGEVIGEKLIRSQWLDMPVSLYNLDIAIDMLHFMASDDEIDRIDSGSAAEKERKFREFWAQRDPTPETEFNELMTEYYRRIDHAYKQFSSLQVPGYETDQGKAYILYGPPDNVERRLPTDAPTREVWHYSNRTLIFEATTGFGDFKLISEQQS